jgi:CBS domain containing-hemolysin-like protein
MIVELLPLLLPLPVPLAAVAVLSGCETALFSLTYQDRLRMARTHPRAAGAVAYLLARPRTLLVLILLLNTAASTIYFLLTSIALLRSSEVWLQVALAAANLLAMTLVGEVVSKMLAARYRVEIARLIAPGAKVVFLACAPLARGIEALVIAPLTRLAVPARRHAPLTPRELDELVALGTQEGTIDADEQRVLQQVIRLSGSRIREIMTHRTDVACVETDATPQQVAALARTGLTRVVLTTGGLDGQVVGILDVKLFLAQAALGKRPTPAQCAEPARYVPDRASLDKLLELLRSTGAKVCLCVSEHGDVTGLVTAQDVVRRLGTELAETGHQIKTEIRQVAPGTWHLPGRLSVRQWVEMFGAETMPRVATVAGLVFAKLGRVPRVGDSVRLGNVKIRVERVEGRVAERVSVCIDATPATTPSPIPTPSPAPASSAGTTGGGS